MVIEVDHPKHLAKLVYFTLPVSFGRETVGLFYLVSMPGEVKERTHCTWRWKNLLLTP